MAICLFVCLLGLAIAVSSDCHGDFQVTGDTFFCFAKYIIEKICKSSDLARYIGYCYLGCTCHEQLYAVMHKSTMFPKGLSVSWPYLHSVEPWKIQLLHAFFPENFLDSREKSNWAFGDLSFDRKNEGCKDAVLIFFLMLHSNTIKNTANYGRYHGVQIFTVFEKVF